MATVPPSTGIAMPVTNEALSEQSQTTAAAISCGAASLRIAWFCRIASFVVEADRAQLGEVVQRVRDGRLRTKIGTLAALDDAVAAFSSTERIKGKTIISVRP